MTPSSTPPGRDDDFDDNFLASNVELEIAHPSPHAEIYNRGDGFGLPSWPVLGGLVGLVCLGLGGLYYYAFQQGLEAGQRSLPPVVLADTKPLKLPPEDIPGGQAGAPDDLRIYDVMRGAPETGTEIVEDPADNADGSIESLIAATPDPFAELDVASDMQSATPPGKADSALPPGNSITVLPDRPGVEVSPPRPDLNRAPRISDRDSATAPAPRPQPVAPAPNTASKPAPKTVSKTGETQIAAAAPAPKPAPVVNGNRQDFMVQLAASRSRALARGVYSRLQGNYSDLLGRRNPLILRVDLGDKGIFYRVNVPGFANRNSADVFCANLKKRGQDCLVRKQP